MVYEDIRGIARGHLRRRSAGHTVQSGTLAHEAYITLVQIRGIRCRNRAHFFALCSQMIRRILVDHARKQRSAKRGGALLVPLDEALLGTKVRGLDVEALDDAINSLARIDPRKGRVVEFRFFGGLSVEETAEVLENKPDKRATHAMVIERVQGLTLRNVEVEWADDEIELLWDSALVLRDIDDLRMEGFLGRAGSRNAGTPPVQNGTGHRGGAPESGSQSMKVAVECYSGRKENDRPVRFSAGNRSIWSKK